MKPATAAETQSTRRHAREAGPQAHTALQHPGMDAPSGHWKNIFTITETDTAVQHSYKLQDTIACQPIFT